MDWNDDLGIIVVGCGQGEIFATKYCRFDPTNHSEIFHQRYHSKSSRVVKVSLNKKNMVVYSVGEEGFFKMINLNNFKEIFSEKVSKKKVTTMVVDHEDYFAAIASLDGNIYIYDIELEVPYF